MAFLSGVNAPREISFLVNFRPVWDPDVRVWDGDIPLDHHRANACRPWRIPDVDSA